MLNKIVQVYKCSDSTATKYLLATSLHVANQEYFIFQTDSLWDLISELYQEILLVYLKGSKTRNWETLADAIIICNVPLDFNDLLKIFTDEQIMGINKKLDAWLEL